MVLLLLFLGKITQLRLSSCHKQHRNVIRFLPVVIEWVGLQTLSALNLNQSHHSAPDVHPKKSFSLQAPSNESLPEALQGKVSPNVIPIHCRVKVRPSPLSLPTVFRILVVAPILIPSVVYSERRMKARSERSIILAWATASLFSTTPTTAKCCTPCTCSPWWPSSLLTSLWIRRCASSARLTGKTSTTATKTATKDALTLSWQSARDLSHDEHSQCETNKM